MAGIKVLFDQAGAAATEDAVSKVFNAFMDSRTVSSRRPFYFHTSDGRLQAVYAAVNAQFSKSYVRLPDVAPSNAAEREFWYEQLAEGDNQGCGHVKFSINEFADYGYDDDLIQKALIKAYYKYWWPTPVGSERRKKVLFEVLQGPLSGKAVAIVGPKGDPKCAGEQQAPAIATSYAGSQVFVYHQSVVEKFRKDVLTPFFARYARRELNARLDEKAFLDALNALQVTQLTSTLTLLSPPNQIRTYSVGVQVQST